MITNKQRAEMMIERLNVHTLNKRQVEIRWNTPNAFMLESHKPGARRIYQVCRNASDGRGQDTYFSGYLPAVVSYLDGMLEGLALAGEAKQS